MVTRCGRSGPKIDCIPVKPGPVNAIALYSENGGTIVYRNWKGARRRVDIPPLGWLLDGVTEVLGETKADIHAVVAR